MNEILLFLLLGLGTGGDDRRNCGRYRRHLPGPGLHQPGGQRDRDGGSSFWALNTGELGITLSTPLAVALSYVVVIVASIVIEFAVFRQLGSAAPLAKLVASLGVLLTAQAVMFLAFGTTQHPSGHGRW